MDTDIQNEDIDLMEGPLEEYCQYVHVLGKGDAVKPGATRVKNLCIKPITVTRSNNICRLSGNRNGHSNAM